MKARIKATGNIVDVELSHYVGDVTWYITKCHALYSENELEFIDEPQDYWIRLEHQAAIAAMQGILSNPVLLEATLINVKKFDLTGPQAVAIDAYHYAHALVEKYKKEGRK